MWRRDGVLVIESVCVPGVDGVVFETGDDGIREGQVEHLH